MVLPEIFFLLASTRPRILGVGVNLCLLWFIGGEIMFKYVLISVVFFQRRKFFSRARHSKLPLQYIEKDYT